MEEDKNDIKEYTATKNCQVKLKKGTAYHPRDNFLRPGEWQDLYEGEKVNYFERFSIVIKQIEKVP
jgi:hypothetical protein